MNIKMFPNSITIIIMKQFIHKLYFIPNFGFYISLKSPEFSGFNSEQVTYGHVYSSMKRPRETFIFVLILYFNRQY